MKPLPSRLVTQTTLDFLKMQGLGNDFIVLDGLRQTIEPDALPLRHMADRRLGIGCDQIMLIEPSTEPECDWRYRIFNADGSEVEQCGNGVRCVALYLWDHVATDRRDLVLQSRAGQIRVQSKGDNRVRVDMGVPRFVASSIPICADTEGFDFLVSSSGQQHRLAAVSMGNPHAVLFVDDIVSAPVDTLGPELECADAFPERCNVGFAEIVSSSLIRLRVWERGVGETLACGSGACAAMVAARRKGLVSASATVQLPGGNLEIEWHKDGSPVMMTGEAHYAYRGSFQHD